MDRKRKIISFILLAVLGISVGFAVSTHMSQDQQSYCESIESQVMQEKNISGTLACFEPGIIQVNQSDKIENNSELRCVCRHEYRGFEQLIPISISN